MSDGGRDRALLGVEVWKSCQKWSVRLSAVRSIAWLGLGSSREESSDDIDRHGHQANGLKDSRLPQDE
jgi:hypothetical protein